jgi:hypothetical protein
MKRLALKELGDREFVPFARRDSDNLAFLNDSG